MKFKTIAAIGSAALIFTYPPISIYKVYGNSMAPTIPQDSWIIVGRFPWFSLHSQIKVNDIVIVQMRKSSDKLLIKRITKIKPNDCTLWLTGDNFKTSIDSRTIGWIPCNFLKGKVLVTLALPKTKSK